MAGNEEKKADINFIIRLTFNIPEVALMRKFISFSNISFMLHFKI